MNNEQLLTIRGSRLTRSELMVDVTLAYIRANA